MLDIDHDNLALSDDSRSSVIRYLLQKQSSGESVVLSIEGEARFEIRDPTSFRLLLKLAERLETIEAIRQGLKEADEGRGRPMDEVLAELEEEFQAKTRP